MLLCFVVCLTLLASFFLPSHLSLKHVYVIMFAIPVTAEADEGEEWSAAVERGKLP